MDEEAPHTGQILSHTLHTQIISRISNKNESLLYRIIIQFISIKERKNNQKRLFAAKPINLPTENFENKIL